MACAIDKVECVPGAKFIWVAFGSPRFRRHSKCALRSIAAKRALRSIAAKRALR
ncbi:hypothetical protein GGF43_004470, partial [Coemansia sp. RSA 2618]